MEQIHKTLRDAKGMRWLVLILVSFTMLCAYYLTDAMAPLQERCQTTLSWSATDYGFFTSGYGWFNVFLLMLVRHEPCGKFDRCFFQTQQNLVQPTLLRSSAQTVLLLGLGNVL